MHTEQSDRYIYRTLHAHWLLTPQKGSSVKWHTECSCCGWNDDEDYTERRPLPSRYLYCPNCGSRMDEEACIVLRPRTEKEHSLND